MEETKAKITPIHLRGWRIRPVSLLGLFWLCLTLLPSGTLRAEELTVKQPDIRRAQTGEKKHGHGDLIHVPVMLHPVRKSGAVSSTRSDEEIVCLFEKAQAIWWQARIVLDMKIEETQLDPLVAEDVQAGDFNPLYRIVGSDKKTLHIFFVNQLDGPNGITAGPLLALIADTTGVDDFRVIAHEIGHLLGLRHTHESFKRLLFPGVNGTELSADEIARARWNACKLGN